MATRPVASVLTLVRDRQAHLDNLIAGLAEQTCVKFELVIASMQERPPAVPADLPFPVRVVPVAHSDTLPLAKARNCAAAAASAAELIFLDVDCIPSPSLVESYRDALAKSDQCFLGEVRYLPKLDRILATDFYELWMRACIHPARPSVPEGGWRSEPNPRQLWGLSFGVRAERYWHVGGMAECYVGYGGEETDFAVQLAAVGTAFAWLGGARAVHQWHRVCTPPLDKFDSIVTNAQRFYDRWNSWCMEHWLERFCEAGYIEWSQDAKSIHVHNQPSAQAIARALQPEDVCFA